MSEFSSFLKIQQKPTRIKKYVLLVLCCLGLFAGAANAQLTYGGKAGLNYSIITTTFNEGEKPDDWENVTGIGFHIGGFVNCAINDKLSIRPELLFSSRGTWISSSSELLAINVDIESTSTCNFVEVPILLGIGGETGLQVHVGPSVNLLLGVKTKTEATTSFGGNSKTETEEITGSEFTQGMRGLDLGVALGAGFNVEGGLGFGARYQRGLTSINEEDTDMVISNWTLIQV